MKNTVYKVASVQINNGFSDHFYLPYSIGLLQSYVMHHSSNKNKYDFKLPIYKRWLLPECVEYLSDCDIVLFSAYVWNVNISRAVAKELKSVNPQVYIIFGGPSVPDNAKEFLLSNRYIDVAVHQEGEKTCLSLLEQYPNINLQDAFGVSYVDHEGQFFNRPSQPRMKDLSQIPSPYLTGVFDGLMQKYPEEKWLVTWETNRGCPFACAYCDWGSATNSTVARMELDRIHAELDWFSQNKIEFIFCADANFGILPRDLEIVEHAIKNKKEYGYPRVLSVQNTKNKRDRAYKVQKLLAESGLTKGVTLAMQSVSAHTLKQIQRDNISLEDYQELQKQFHKDGISTYTEFILALPGDTYETFANGVSEVITSGQHNRIQYNNLSILPNAEMAKPDYIEQHQLKMVEAPIVNMHGSLDETPADGIVEKQLLVISTATLPTDDWIKMRAYASTSEFLYFCKLLQIPFQIIHQYFDVPYRSLFELFLNAKDKHYPVLSQIIHIFYQNAKDILAGGAEFIFNKDWLDIYWPPGEYGYIYISINQLLDDFYKEAYQLLISFLKDPDSDKIIRDAVEYNQFILNQPLRKVYSISLEYTVHLFYQDMMSGKEAKIEKQPITLEIDQSDIKQYKNWHDWMREVVWYGHRSGAYLLGAKPMVKNIAGHY